jgi:spore photoproduct lyase
MSDWRPNEIIIHEAVREDSVTEYFLVRCKGIPVKLVENGDPRTIVAASDILCGAGNSMLQRILAGKGVIYISPASTTILDTFIMPDDRMVCPHFERLKLASNGCFYQCDWCYLKLTYRAAFPFITVRAQYDRIKGMLEKRLKEAKSPLIFHTGELADSLSLEHLTRGARVFIPWFGQTENGYLFMLTKSANIDQILNLPHNGHTIIAWSMNNEEVSRRYEIGAPSFGRRLDAASKVQAAGYPLRIRLDPIIPFKGWQRAYAESIKQIFNKVSPERVTVGTLRFEKSFYNMRNNIFTSGAGLHDLLREMKPMFPPKMFPGSSKPRSGKYSFTESKRAEIFEFVITEIRKLSNCQIALCKESPTVWEMVGLPLSKCSCTCQLDFADMTSAIGQGVA